MNPIAAQLKARSKRFAVDVLRLCDQFPNSFAGRHVAGQLLRAASSSGAHYRAACRGRSRREFIAKIGTAVEEADEAGYWLEIAEESNLKKSAESSRLLAEAEELTRIFAASSLTASENERDEQRRRRLGEPGT